jgi:hypothetical protein
MISIDHDSYIDIYMDTHEDSLQGTPPDKPPVRRMRR